jgi:nitric oxide dioxygenase
MTPQQITLVQQSWTQVEPMAEQAASLFYGRLFETDPSTRPLFTRSTIPEQGRKLMQMITVVVRGLDHVEELLPAIQGLARRHVDYGVRREHYASVGAALLWTLEQGLGAAYTPQVREAWTEAYGLLSSVMLQSVTDVPSAPAPAERV